MVDTDLILRKLSGLDVYLGQLQEYTGISAEAYGAVISFCSRRRSWARWGVTSAFFCFLNWLTLIKAEWVDSGEFGL